ncbi:hypothetical protein ES702_04775 [subsurface metagenome]
MIVEIPLTGEIVDYDPEHPQLAVGSDTDPVRPVDLRKLLPVELWDFAWRATEFDFENGMVTIETIFVKKRLVTERDTEGVPIAWRMETDLEFNQRQAASEKALRGLKKKTMGELYQITGEPGLKKPESLNDG